MKPDGPSSPHPGNVVSGVGSAQAVPVKGGVVVAAVEVAEGNGPEPPIPRRRSMERTSRKMEELALLAPNSIAHYLQAPVAAPAPRRHNTWNTERRNLLGRLVSSDAGSTPLGTYSCSEDVKSLTKFRTASPPAAIAEPMELSSALTTLVKPPSPEFTDCTIRYM